MTKDNREHFQLKIKIILERLDTIEPLVLRKHRKLIVNIHKTLGRLDKKKKQKQKQEEYQKRVKEQRAAEQDAAMVESEPELRAARRTRHCQEAAQERAVRLLSA